MDTTDRLIQVGKMVKTEVEDHLIITEKSYLSFALTGLIDKLKLSTKYVPEFQIEEKVKKQANEIAKEKAKKEVIKVARKLKASGADIDFIVEMTGLTTSEVEKKIKVRRTG